jgi:hypothetical protein
MYVISIFPLQVKNKPHDDVHIVSLLFSMVQSLTPRINKQWSFDSLLHEHQ